MTARIARSVREHVDLLTLSTHRRCYVLRIAVQEFEQLAKRYGSSQAAAEVTKASGEHTDAIALPVQAIFMLLKQAAC